MRRSSLGLVLMILAATSCGPSAATTPSPEPTATMAEAPAATPTHTLPPPTPPPTPVPIAFYHLRIELTTTSDWTTLSLDPAEHLLTARLVNTQGNPTYTDAGTEGIALNQPLDGAEAGESVGLTADLALQASGGETSLRLRIEKGHLGTSQVRVSVLTNGEARLLGEFRHQGVVPNPGDRNPRTFEVDLAPLADLAPEVGQSGTGTFPRLLWAFYYPWYTRADWSSPVLRDHPVEPYNSADRATIERHVRQAMEAGIDGFISSWWGPGGDTDAALRTLLDVAQDEGFLVTIYFETLTGEGHLSASEITRWLSYALRNYGDHPAFARVDGKPVVMLWASGAVPLETWQGCLDDVRRQGVDAFSLGMGYSLANLAVFDGLHEYGVFTIADLETTVAATGAGVHNYGLLDDERTRRLWAATVQPGYDDRLVPGREGLLQERDDGAFYRRTWEAALASDPDWILISTWNEWWEHTHIEPSQAFGDLYLDITREYAAAWKGE